MTTRTQQTMRQKNRSEEFKLTCSVAQYLQLLENQGKLTYCHVPMGEIRSARTGAKLKKMGARAGMPDFLIWAGSMGANGFNRNHFAIEMKAKEGRKSDNQKAMQERLNRHGFSYYEARSVSDVVLILKSEDVI